MECKGGCGFFGTEDKDGFCSFCAKGFDPDCSKSEHVPIIRSATEEKISKLSLGLREKKVIERGNGLICEVKSASQTDEAFKDIISKYQSPSYICGQFSCANASYISSHYPKEEMSRDEIQQMITELQKLQTVYNHVEDLLSLWNTWRNEWITNHPDEFQSEKEKKSYLKDWVANYEISDWMKFNNDKGIAFVRIVGIEDEEKVKHEEGIRYKEEAPFRESDIIFIDDPFLQEGQQYWHPEEWEANYFENKTRTTKVFIADVSGHFVVFKPVVLVDGDRKQNILLLVNSFHCDTLPNFYTSAFYDLYFEHSPTLSRK